MRRLRPRHGPNEALHFGLVVVVVHAGADERVQSACGLIERGRPRRAGHALGPPPLGSTGQASQVKQGCGHAMVRRAFTQRLHRSEA
jgi:hypothetical protein